MRRLIRWVAAILGLAAIIIAACFLLIYSGIYNVAATHPDRAPVAWVLSQTMDSSVKKRASGIKMPPLDDPSLIKLGHQHYKEMCHDATGVQLGEIGRGLNPKRRSLLRLLLTGSPTNCSG